MQPAHDDVFVEVLTCDRIVHCSISVLFVAVSKATVALSRWLSCRIVVVVTYVVIADMLASSIVSRARKFNCM